MRQIHGRGTAAGARGPNAVVGGPLKLACGGFYVFKYKTIVVLPMGIILESKRLMAFPSFSSARFFGWSYSW